MPIMHSCYLSKNRGNTDSNDIFAVLVRDRRPIQLLGKKIIPFIFSFFFFFGEEQGDEEACPDKIAVPEG